MSEEEKKAIDKLQYTIEINQNILDGIEIDEQVIKSMEITLNLIDKQQKEIKKLKDDLREERALNVGAYETLKECVHKDTIIKKIKELDSLLYGIEDRDKLGERADVGSVNSLLSQISILNSLI